MADVVDSETPVLSPTTISPSAVESDGSTGGSGDGDLILEARDNVNNIDSSLEKHHEQSSDGTLKLAAPVPTAGSLASASTATSVRPSPAKAMPLPAAPRSCSYGGGLCELMVVEAIQEYMSFHGMEDSLRTLREDIESRSIATNTGRAGSVDNDGRAGAARRALLGSELAVARALADFDAGRRDALFEVWNTLVPAVASDSPKGCALELRLRVHFGVHSTRQVLSAAAVAKVVVAENAMATDATNGNIDATPVPEPDLEDLKIFISSHPAANLDDTAESLAPLFALPFVPQPHTRPGFKFIFEDAWVQKLRADLQAFLSPHASARHAPLIRHLAGNLVIARGPQAAPPPGSWHELVRIADLGLAAATRIQQSTSSATGSSGVRRGANFFKDIAQARWRLASVAAQPDVAPPPPTSAQAQRALGSFEGVPEMLVDGLWPCSREGVPSLSASGRDASYRDALRSPPKRLHSARTLESRARTATALLPVPPALDFGRIAAVIAGEYYENGALPKASIAENATSDEAEHSPPLQAVLRAVLRRLALPDEPVRPRRTFLAAFACFGALRALAERLPDIIDKGNETTSELALAVLAVCACEAVGRKEIEQAEIIKPGCIAAMVMVLQRAPVGSPLHLQCLAVLQRLSLRRRLQSKMIVLGVVDSVLQTLKFIRSSESNCNGSGSWQNLGAVDENGTPDFALEFASALLMNLTLRSAGRRRCSELGVYDSLIGLIEHPNAQVRTHVNGSLYSLLGFSEFRATAQQSNAETTFRYALQRVPPTDPLLKKQLEYLLTQLSRVGSAEGEDEDSDAESDRGAAGDVDDGENFLDEEELAGHFLLVPNPGRVVDNTETEASATAVAEAVAAEEALRFFRAVPAVADTQQRRFHAFIACSAGGLCSPIGKRRSRLGADLMGGSPSPYGLGPGIGPLLPHSPSPVMMEESSPIGSPAHRHFPQREIVLDKAPAMPPVSSIEPVLPGNGIESSPPTSGTKTNGTAAPQPQSQGELVKARAPSNQGPRAGSNGPLASRLRPPRVVSNHRNANGRVGSAAGNRSDSSTERAIGTSGNQKHPAPRGGAIDSNSPRRGGVAGDNGPSSRTAVSSNLGNRGRVASTVPTKGAPRNANSAPPALLPPIAPSNANAAEHAAVGSGGARSRSRSAVPTPSREVPNTAGDKISMVKATVAATDAALAAGGVGGLRRRPPKSVPAKTTSSTPGTSSLPQLPVISQRRNG
mmetsp:Transcript_67501/g.106888  ORF Transcript_67501/g.106888 Transcript_67501/m.106888 type:complete len:1225 (-) Transcript_67501:69-3743(-)